MRTPAELEAAQVLVFPGVGCFGSCIDFLDGKGFREPLLKFINSGKPFMGICLGMQSLFETSEETPGRKGLGLISGSVDRFPSSPDYSVPHIGWNGINVHKQSPALAELPAAAKVYFVHSYRAAVTPANADWVLSTTDYGGQRFISAVARGNVFATQFHPEKSGAAGLAIFRAFLSYATAATASSAPAAAVAASAEQHDNASQEAAPESYEQIMSRDVHPATQVCRRIVACLDVRTNDDGDLVVTKGDKYDVREKVDTPAAADGAQVGSDAKASSGNVRNLGKPVELSARYYDEGADEVAFLNITGWYNGVAAIFVDDNSRVLTSALLFKW